MANPTARRKSLSHFLSCDWGTSSFRLRLISLPGLRVIDEVRTADGAKVVHTRLVERGDAGDPAQRSAAFATVLRSGIEAIATRNPSAIDHAPVVISGMASSTVGWRELPYAKTPCPIDGSALRIEELEPVDAGTSHHRVQMISGLTTGHDLMRGEESEIVGLMKTPDLESLGEACQLILPGTHSKHVRIEGARLTDFHTYMTGELLELLSTRSLLSVSVQWPPPALETGGAPAREAFERGVGLARDSGLDRGLFQVRVRSVLERVAPVTNAHFLAGLLIGSELLDLVDERRSTPILLAAGAAFLATYRLALDTLGAGPRTRAASEDELRLAVVRTHAQVLARNSAG